jgi:hypothetical protein
MNPKKFFGELKRRNVYKVAIAYAVVAWLLMRVARLILSLRIEIRFRFQEARSQAESPIDRQALPHRCLPPPCLTT